MNFLTAFVLFLTSTSALDLSDVEKAEGRITNGQTAVVGQFPYQVGIRIKEEGSTSSWCGGALISKEWLLTAAHCLEKAMEVTVYLGTIVRHESKVEYTIPENNIIVHPEWLEGKKRNDIALIKIPSTELSDVIQPIKLPALADSEHNYVGENAIISGWGHLSDSNDELPTYLQWGVMKVVTNDKCMTLYPFVHSTNICANPINNASTCTGDSGGPIATKNRKMLLGLDSFSASIGCSKGFPVVFTRITSYLKWIESEANISY